MDNASGQCGPSAQEIQSEFSGLHCIEHDLAGLLVDTTARLEQVMCLPNLPEHLRKQIEGTLTKARGVM